MVHKTKSATDNSPKLIDIRNEDAERIAKDILNNPKDRKSVV